MDEVSLEKSKISLFSSETIITLFIHSFTIREYDELPGYTRKADSVS